eukprot:m.28418 g.28418  ORF g.28418 m.28418 type:complete len:233 (-) comp11834_c0_seq1:112-810(-)
MWPLLLQLLSFWTYIVRVVPASWLYFLSWLPQRREDLDRLARRSATWPKRPSHVCLVIDEAILDYRSISRLVTWCMAYNVPRISIYDTRGRLHKNPEGLFAFVVKHQQQHHAEWSSNHRLNKEGLESEQGQYQLQVLGPVQGRQDIVKAVRKASQQPSPLTVDQFRALLHNPNTPEPELLIKFGEADLLNYVTPWQLRVTELQFLPSHKGLHQGQLFKCFQRYAKCHQRFGK